MQRAGITPTSTDPTVATLYAIESSKHGNSVVDIFYPNDLSDVQLHPGNLAHDLEVGVELTPLDLAKRSSVITLDQARTILQEMGIEGLPSQINSFTDLGESVRDFGSLLTEDQKNEFYLKAINIQNK